MTREELLQNAKPILFNTDMVRAILDGRKTVTRRVVKLKHDNTHHEMKTDKYGTRLIEIENDIEGETFGKREDGTTWRRIRGYIEPKAPYKKGDILYVRETWNICNMCADGNTIVFIYKADKSEEESVISVKVSDELYDKYERSMAENNPEWRPSIHMPKEAARIFLKVTNVRVELLRAITDKDALKEGSLGVKCDHAISGTYGCTDCMNTGWLEPPTLEFMYIWDSTIKKSDLNRYGWDANPWVWVIRFERVTPDE